MIRIERLHKSFGSQIVLDDVNLEIGPGITALLGPNGAGKTTLLRCLATTLIPDAGTVQFGDLTLSKAQELWAVRQNLGYMPQEMGLYPSFTVSQFLEHIAVLKGLVDKEWRLREVDRVLQTIGMGDRRAIKIRKLSGGMRRRIHLGQALLGSPKYLLLDEPTVGLDPEQRMRFRAMISASTASDRIVVLSTHQTEDVTAISSNVIVLAEGRILFRGQATELAGVASGRVWLSDEEPEESAISWQVGSGRHRSIGKPPTNSRELNPTLEDGYLALLTDAGLNADVKT